MKRTAALLLFLCALILGMRGLAESPEADMAGTWVMTRYLVNGQEIDNPAAQGSSKVMLFNEDGTAVITINKNVYYGTWAQRGGVIHLLYEDGDQADFTVEPEQLVYTPAGQTQIFTRQIIYADGSDFACRALSDGSLEIIGYSGDAAALNIPAEIDGSPVRVIGTAAFASQGALLSVTVPRGVVEIKPFAFYGCAKLARVSLPHGLSRIGASAFQNCESLARIIVPEDVETLEYASFSGCRRLLTVRLPASLRTIESLAFAGCQSLKGIVVPAGSQTLADAVFSGCESMTEVILPASLTAIHGAPFAGCGDQLIVTAPSGSYAAEWYAQSRGK